MTSRERSEQIRVIRSITDTMESTQTKWFIAFGTLLHLLRDRVFDLTDDIDVGVITEDYKAVHQAFSLSHKKVAQVVNDVTGNPLKVTYQMPDSKLMIDIFFWQKRGSLYYHTYDEEFEQPKSGVLSKYKFRGVEAECFDVDEANTKAYQKNIHYREAFRPDGTWMAWVPGYEGESLYTVLPYGYGRCLDLWYQNWALRNDQFGCSVSPYVKEVRSCKDL